MTPTIRFVLLTLISLPVVRVSSYKVSISPDHKFLSKSLRSVTVTCNADVALTGCQFQWRDNKGNDGQPMDLSRGSQSVSNPAHLDIELLGYSYSGRGLAAGDCGITMQMEGMKHWMLGCRVRVQNDAWEYAWMDLFAHGWDILPFTDMPPREVVVLPGGETSILAKAQERLRLCHFTLPDGVAIHFDKGPKSVESTGQHLYHGAGLGDGECGITLSGLTEANNGPVGVYSETFLAHDHAFTAVIVAHPPSSPVLKVVLNGANIEATCFVNESRPVAGITWLVGSDIVREDMLDDTPSLPQDEWRWPWVQASITQKLVRTLTSEDNGKELKCRVSHVTLLQPLETSEKIEYTEPPVATEPPVEDSPLPTEPPMEDSPPPTSPIHTIHSVEEVSPSILKVPLQKLIMQPPLLPNTSCPSEELQDLRATEARTLGVATDYAVQIGKVNLETAQANAKAAKAYERAAEAHARAAEVHERAAEAHAREEEAAAKYAEEELEFLREQHNRTLLLQQVQT